MPPKEPKATKGRPSSSSTIDNSSPSESLRKKNEASKKRASTADTLTNTPPEKIVKRPRKEVKSANKIKDSDSEGEYDLRSRLGNEDEDEEDEGKGDTKARLTAELKSRKIRPASVLSSRSGTPSKIADKTSVLSSSSPSAVPRGSTPGVNERLNRQRSDTVKPATTGRTKFSGPMVRPDSVTFSSPLSDKHLAGGKPMTPSPRTTSAVMPKINFGTGSPAGVAPYSPAEQATLEEGLSKPVRTDVLAQILAANPAASNQASSELNLVNFTIGVNSIDGVQTMNAHITAKVGSIEDSQVEKSLQSLILYLFKCSKKFQETTGDAAARRVLKIFQAESTPRTLSFLRSAIRPASDADNETDFLRPTRFTSGEPAGSADIDTTVEADCGDSDVELKEEAEENGGDGVDIGDELETQGHNGDEIAAELDNDSQPGEEVTANLD
ncbi:hypothetical protein H2200_012992 [Cladophialophora chaetospira]|uniref:Uncharacterized protein n=1 Tax=Cladophialophora chaetospira TaxID=386627 RepID=A0AA39CBQ1_9EURO|nr:hypothetical protein H2200_012992 [Cladophialophora chaetospira]